MDDAHQKWQVSGQSVESDCGCSAARSCPTLSTPWTAARQASLALSISRSWPTFTSIALVMPSSHLVLRCPHPLLPSIFPSIRDFSNELGVHIRWPKYWSFSISPSNEYSGLIFLKTDWFEFCAVQGTFKSLLQYHSSKASVLWHSAFFTVQLNCKILVYNMY